MAELFTVSVEHIDDEYVLCPLGDDPPGFSDVPGFPSKEAAAAWLHRWAATRQVTLKVLQPGCEWKVYV